MPVSPSLPRPAAGPARTWTLWTGEGPVDVEVSAPDDAILGDVLGPMATGLALPAVQLWSQSVALPSGTPLSAASLRHGAVLGLGRPGPREASGAEGGVLELHVTGGPDAGRRFPLGQGSVVVGRGAGCGLTVADPDVSRRHVVVAVGEGRVSVADLGSSNGTSRSDADRARRSVGAEGQDWPVGARVQIGSTTLRLTGPEGAPLEQLPAAAGRQLVRPLPSAPRPPRSVEIRLPAPPVDQPRRRLGWVAVALPAVGGLLMAWLLTTPQFLFFALLSPLVAVTSWVSDRVTGRRAQARAVAEHALARALADEALATAVATAVAAREEEHPDPARLAAAARRRCGPLWSRTATDPGGLTLRLGSGPGPTTVTRVAPDGARTAALADRLPVTVALDGSGGLGIVGPRPAALGVARALVCQLAVLTSPAQVHLVLACSRPRAADWDWLRWLPHLRTVLLPGEGLPGSAPGEDGGAPRTVVVLDGPMDGVLRDALAGRADRLIRLEVAPSEAALALPTSATVEVTGETGATGRLRVAGVEEERLLVLDALSRSTARGIARDLAALTVPARSGTLPDSAHLLALPGSGLHLGPEDVAVGPWPRERSRLLAVLGTTGREELRIDLVADGPHALIAGTTGSGKSELLQTLVTSLALHQPPDRCTFLLVDYKGGAAFGEAAGLPHTVGLLTDLDHQSTARALRSLSAELTRRERLLAQHGARDVAELPDDVPVSRLVIAVDEFATLVQDLPGFVSGLVGIAQRGRSLGVHLVLATQRPAGVVSPEVRANCSLRICLRTTDDSDARDVLGSTAAAHLPPDRPGRAYLRTGSTPPVLFQVARVSGTSRTGETEARARRHPWPPLPELDAAADTVGGATDLQRLVAAVAARAREEGVPPAGRPWLPPLPDRLDVGALDRGAAADDRRTRLLIGLQDLPDAQAQVPLALDLAAGGGWLLVGGPRSGRTTALRTVLTEAVRRLPPSRLHVHVLDHGGGTVAREAVRLPHCGTAVGGSDAHRTVRLLARLGAEVERRRGGGAVVPAEPLLLLLVDGYESLVAQLEDADPATGAAGLLRLARDGAAVGVSVVLTAERAVPGGRLAAAVGTRLVLPLPDRADYAVAGVPARSVPGHRPPGRALFGEEAVECQLAVPREYLPLDEPIGAGTGRPAGPVPIRVVELPADPELPLPGGGDSSCPDRLWLPLGPGGDDGAVVDLDLQRTGGLLVAGPPGSGRSAALEAFGRHCGLAGAAVADVRDHTAQTLREWVTDQVTSQVTGHVTGHVTGRAPSRPVVLLADDLTTLPDPVLDAIGASARPEGGVLVLASGTAGDLAASFRGPAVALRRSRTALLLRPAPGDAELLGLRTPRTPLPARPGAGWLVTPMETARVQVARRRTAPVPS